jgi:hypothetical protein
MRITRYHSDDYGKAFKIESPAYWFAANKQGSLVCDVDRHHPSGQTAARFCGFCAQKVEEVSDQRSDEYTAEYRQR